MNKTRELALKHGFKLKLQADGSHDLNQYVYDFADELLATKDPIIDNLLDRLNKARETGQYYLRETQQQRKELSDLRGSVKELYNTIQRQTTTIRNNQGTIARQATTVQEQQGLIDMLSKSINDQRVELKERQELIDNLPKDPFAVDGEKALNLEDGPGYEDGCDHEGFPGGCERMGHTADTCPEYVTAIGDAGEKYISSKAFGGKHRLPAQFRWYELWEVMVKASKAPVYGLMSQSKPTPMILYCPSCGEQHIDEGNWATIPHRSHLCHHCDHQWRPADVPTIGVASIKTKGKLDSHTKMVKLVGPVVAKLRYLIQSSIHSKVTPTRDLKEALRLIDKEMK